MNTPLQWLALGLVSILGLCANTSQAQSSTPPQLVYLPGGITAQLEQDLYQQDVSLLHAYGHDLYLMSRMPREGSSPTTKQRAALDVHAPSTLSARGHARLRVDLVLAYSAASNHLTQVLAKADFQADEAQVTAGTTLRGSVPASQLQTLLDHHLILNATQAEENLQPYNFECRIGQSVTAINSGIPGAPALNGQGVVLGVGDGGQLAGHPDVGNRVIHSTETYLSSWGNHPDMVSGIMSGAGNLNPRHRGVAPEAELVIDVTSGIVYRAPNYLASHGMTITNNSYGPSFSCNYSGMYYGSAASMDNQLFDEPKLMHVYAAGNSGRATCGSLPTGYGTIASGAQVAKNVLSVGNATYARGRYASSSAGPTKDGRLKPEIIAIGHDVISSNRDESYGSGSGTSFSSPGVAGVLGLLSQRYQELNPGQLPDGALLKALACNTAEDLGNPGPDYLYGFGLIDAPRALRALEQGQYGSGSLVQGATATQAITVGAGTEQLKVMLYWPDNAGPTTNDRSTLINDFDLVLVTPAGDSLRPWILNPDLPAQAATRGIDTINNIEQVTVAAPAPGSYQLVVRAISLPLGTTDFYTTWEAEQPEVLLTCPYGGESLSPTTSGYIAWRASSGQVGTWKVEYRTVGGAWQSVSNNVAASLRSLAWTPPATAGEYEIRVTNNATGISDMTNQAVSVLATPADLSSTNVCDGSLLLQWSAVSSATGYTVSTFDGNEMVATQVVTDTFYLTPSFAEGSKRYYAVAANSPFGKTGQRTETLVTTATHNGSGCYSPLPVDWLGIQAQKQDGDVRVSWQVATEVNSSHYEVMRGLPIGDTLQWEVITRVESQEGDAQDARSYEARDTQVPNVPTVYYRVQQVDLDGSTDDSAIVSVDVASSTLQVVQPISLAQNPVQDVLRLHNDSNESVSVDLYDVAGKRLQTWRLEPGRNTHPWPASLGSGLYLLSIDHPSLKGTIKLVK